MRLAFVLAIVAARSALAAYVLPHSGYLVASDDVPVSGARSFSFALHATSTGGTAEWSSGACSLTVRSGRYDVALGEGCGAGIPSDKLFASRWLEVVVEGIENPVQASLLRNLGVRFGQGYHLGRPVPASELSLGSGAAARRTSA